MTDTSSNLWTRRERDAFFAEPGACEKRLTRFERTIRRRNLIEYIAGGLVIALFGAGAIGAGSAGMWDFAVGSLLVVFGTVFVMLKLRASGSNLHRRPEDTCREHLRAQYAHQRDLLKNVPLWYLAPLLPGIFAIYGITMVRVAGKVGWATAIEGAWLPLAATAAFFVFVAWLNLYAARQLDRKLSELDTIG